MVNSFLRLNTHNNTAVVFSARDIVALEEASTRDGTTRVYLPGGHVLVVKQPLAQLADAIEKLQAPNVPGTTKKKEDF